MDCFYVQVEQRLNPSVKDKPCAVVQYKKRGIIAVGYKARKFGVKRGMTANDAQKLCPNIALLYVTETRGKADLTKYRKASTEVMESLAQFSSHLERASIDEAYLDITSAVEKRMKTMPFSDINADRLKSTRIVGWEESECERHSDTAEDTEEEDNDSVSADDKYVIDDDIDINSLVSIATEAETLETHEHAYECNDAIASSSARLVVDSKAQFDGQSDGMQRWLSSGLDEGSKRLAYGAVIVNEIRAAVFTDTGFTCSAGISHNKVLSKLACGFHKPNQQTVLCRSSVSKLFSNLPLKKLRNLGGKLGASIAEKLCVTHIGDLCQYTQQRLQEEFGDKTGHWLFNVCRGLDLEPVRPRQLTKSIGCSKNFKWNAKLACHEQIKYWFLKFAEELYERLSADMTENSRVAQHLAIHYQFEDSSGASRSCPLSHYDVNHMAHLAYTALLKACSITPSMCHPCEAAGPTQWSPPIVNLGMFASQFVPLPSQSIDRFLTATTVSERPRTQTTLKRPSHSKSLECKERKGILNFFPKRAKTECDAEVNNDKEMLISTTTSDVLDDQVVSCSKCKQKVARCDMQEHEDYHIALQLQQQLSATVNTCMSGSKTGKWKEQSSTASPNSRQVRGNIFDFFEK